MTDSGEKSPDDTVDSQDDTVDAQDDEPSEIDINAEREKIALEIARLRSGTPEEQKQAVILELTDKYAQDLNPTDAAEIQTALKDFQESKEFAQLSPEEVEARMKAIADGVISGKQGATAEEVAVADEALQNPNITPVERQNYESVVR